MYRQHLDLASSVPAAAVMTVDGIDSRASSMAVDEVEAEQGRHEPKKSREEGKGNVGLELAALVSRDGVHVAPVEDVAARVAQHLHKQQSDSPFYKARGYV